MSMSIPKLVEAISDKADCDLKPVGTLPDVGTNKLPSDLKEFYSIAGGAILFRDSTYPIEIVSPSDFVRSNPIIIGKVCEDDITYDWYVVARDGEQYVTIDLATPRNGRCYDSFWDSHGVPGSCPIVAQSFSKLLEKLLESEGNELFWLEPQFESLGDAYDLTP